MRTQPRRGMLHKLGKYFIYILLIIWRRKMAKYIVNSGPKNQNGVFCERKILAYSAIGLIQLFDTDVAWWWKLYAYGLRIFQRNNWATLIWKLIFSKWKYRCLKHLRFGRVKNTQSREIHWIIKMIKCNIPASHIATLFLRMLRNA